MQLFIIPERSYNPISLILSLKLIKIDYFHYLYFIDEQKLYIFRFLEIVYFILRLP